MKTDTKLIVLTYTMAKLGLEPLPWEGLEEYTELDQSIVFVWHTFNERKTIYSHILLKSHFDNIGVRSHSIAFNSMLHNPARKVGDKVNSKQIVLTLDEILLGIDGNVTPDITVKNTFKTLEKYLIYWQNKSNLKVLEGGRLKIYD